ncbi:MAG: hypothetical protein KAH34_17955 [Ketobacter sp.]|nr:hypothetical protein [Ketobacter sp.]
MSDETRDREIQNAMFRLMVDMKNTWERGTDGADTHRDAQGTLTVAGGVILPSFQSVFDDARTNPDSPYRDIFYTESGELREKWSGLADGVASESDLEQLTQEEAVVIFRERYFEEYGIDQLPPEIQAQVFDIGVNCGPGRSIQLLKATLVDEGYIEAPEGYVPGDLSSDNLARLNGIDQSTMNDAAERMVAERGMAANNVIADKREAYYEHLMEANPDLAVNRPGWMRRTNGFRVGGEDTEFSTAELEQLAAAGFRVEDGVVRLPEPTEIGGEEFVEIPGVEGQTPEQQAAALRETYGEANVQVVDGKVVVAFDAWYWENVLRQSTSNEATYDERRTRERQGDIAPPAPFSPQDQMNEMMMGLFAMLIVAFVGPEEAGEFLRMVGFEPSEEPDGPQREGEEPEEEPEQEPEQDDPYAELLAGLDEATRELLTGSGISVEAFDLDGDGVVTEEEVARLDIDGVEGISQGDIDAIRAQMGDINLEDAEAVRSQLNNIASERGSDEVSR